MKFVQPIRSTETLEEIKDYLRVTSKRNYILFVIGINTGLRISDLLNLRVSMVKGTHITIRTQKRNKPLSIKINQELRKDLDEYIAGMGAHEFLFKSRSRKIKTGARGQPLSRSGAYKMLKQVANKFDLEEIGTHSLRKTFGYHFYRRTKDISLLMEMFNHSEQSITLRYIGIKQDTLDDAFEGFSL